MGSHVAQIRPMIATVCRSTHQNLQIFFLLFEALTNDGGPGCYLRLLQIGSPMGPTGEDSFLQGEKSQLRGANNSWGPVGRSWVIIW